MESFDYIDLFSGIGGFHQAMDNIGGKCVFSSEIDKNCIEVYKTNYGINSNNNITIINEKDIPPHQVLCAGFPCQTFSIAGKKLGFKDKTKGTLFFEIVRILEYHKPKYIILENVKNLVSHDNGNTWNTIQESLRGLGYRTTSKPLILSPHQFGIPHFRERVIILGKYEPNNIDKPIDINFVNLLKKEDCNAYSIIKKEKTSQDYNISSYENYVLDIWDEFYKGIKEKTIGFPIWAYELDKTYKLTDSIPKWKRDIIEKNRNLYNNNKTFIDNWLVKHNYLDKLKPSHKKLEWQASDKISSLWEGIIQFRPSGVRVKTPTCFPALVAMVQTPIIGKFKRRITVEEAASLQSFPNSFQPCSIKREAYKQFGNSVNVTVIEECAKKLFCT